MFQRTNEIKSELHPNLSANGKCGILHLYADDTKILLVLEKQFDEKRNFFVKEANVRLAPLRYQSDVLGSDKVSIHDPKSIRDVLTGLEDRCQIVLSADNSQVVEDRIKEKIDPKDNRFELLINPNREEYLSRVFYGCPTFEESLKSLVSAASKTQKSNSCTIL